MSKSFFFFIIIIIDNMLVNVFENDPAQFSLKNFESNANISLEIISKILEMGPCQPLSIEHPRGKYPIINGHRFSPNLYHRILPDCNKTELFIIF